MYYIKIIMNAFTYEPELSHIDDGFFFDSYNNHYAAFQPNKGQFRVRL